MHTIGSIIYVVCWVETWLIIGRVLLSWFPSVDYGSPLIRALCAVTDPVLRFFRPILPTMAGIDLSPILAIVTLRLLGSAFDRLANGSLDPVQFVVYVIAQVLLAVIIMACIVVFLRIILSLFHADPFHPATQIIRDMSRPLVSPFTGLRTMSRALDVPAVAAFAVFLVAYFVVDRIFAELLIHV